MTDILFERFAVLADLTDESDWLDVRRRARRRHLHIVVAAAAAVVAFAVVDVPRELRAAGARNAALIRRELLED